MATIDFAQKGSLQAILDNPVQFVTAAKQPLLKLNPEHIAKSSAKSPTTSKSSSVIAKGHEGDGVENPKLVLFPADGLLTSWRSILMNPPGLHNVGNTCFLNSVMQTLMHVPSLVQYLLTGQHSSTCQMNNCVFCTVEDHAKKAFPSHGSRRGQAFAPAIAKHLKLVGKRFRPGRQEDAHEFLILLLDAMQTSVLQGHKTLDVRSKETTVVHRMFGGYMRQQIICQKCQVPSNTYEATLALSLDVTDSIQSSLAKMTSFETLTGRNRYKCEKCKALVEARKQTTIYKTPRTLILHLKRFQFAARSSKITKPVTYPSTLDISPYLSSSTSPSCTNSGAGGNLTKAKYELTGVIVHSGGGVGSGHYFAFGKASSSSWYEYNDSSVSTVGIDRALKQQAYILMYTQCENLRRDQSSLSVSASASKIPNGNTYHGPIPIPNFAKHTPTKSSSLRNGMSTNIYSPHTGTNRKLGYNGNKKRRRDSLGGSDGDRRIMHSMKGKNK